MILRTWRCLNRRCGKDFESFDKANPPCTHCGCVKVAWIPGGGHVAKVAPAADATLRSLARDYGMSNLNSPSHSRLNRSMPKFDQPAADMPVRHFAPGFAAPVSSAGSTCQESAGKIDFRCGITTNRTLASSQTVAGPRLNTVVTASDKGMGSAA